MTESPQKSIDLEKLKICSFDEIDAVDLREFLVDAQEDFWDASEISGQHDSFWFRQFADSGLVARYDGETIGYLLGAIPLRGPAYVHLVAARKDHRHLGIGRKLYDAFIESARESGVSKVEATTLPGNSHAIGFHTSLGFSGELVKDYAGPGNDRVFLQMPLS